MKTSIVCCMVIASYFAVASAGQLRDCLKNVKEYMDENEAFREEVDKLMDDGHLKELADKFVLKVHELCDEGLAKMIEKFVTRPKVQKALQVGENFFQGLSAEDKDQIKTMRQNIKDRVEAGDEQGARQAKRTLYRFMKKKIENSDDITEEDKEIIHEVVKAMKRVMASTSLNKYGTVVRKLKANVTPEQSDALQAMAKNKDFDGMRQIVNDMDVNANCEQLADKNDCMTEDDKSQVIEMIDHFEQEHQNK